MRQIDELHLEHPFMGARMLRDQLDREDRHVGRRHIRTLMQRMGIEALAPQPGTRKRAPGNKIYPYLLRKLPIVRATSLGARHRLHPDGPGLCVPQRRGGCIQPPGVDPQGGDHAGGLSCQRNHRRGLCPLRHARDYQHQSGQPFTAIEFTMPFWPEAASSAWTGAGPGERTSLSNASGVA